MPELPEVETIRRTLVAGYDDRPSVIGQEITAARVLWDRTIALPLAGEFAQRVVGQAIVDVGRRGKFFVFQLSDDWMLIHLRMSGDLHLDPVIDELAPHDRVVLDFASGWRLVFNNPRKFGRVWLVDDPQQVLANLGPEPLDDSYTASQFYADLQKRKRVIKSLLLDQHFIAGIGNIYADEALFRAGIHPQSASNQISQTRATKLLEGIRAALREGILRNGASIDWVYRGGDFQNYFQVYKRNGEPCTVCGTPIERILVGQRGTHFCPQCQLRN